MKLVHPALQTIRGMCTDEAPYTEIDKACRAAIEVAKDLEAPSVPNMAIGSDVWPGLAKLAEECGELQQVIGKIIAYPAGEHPDGAGDLANRLRDEMGDVAAAIAFVVEANEQIKGHEVAKRQAIKSYRFACWHEEARRPCPSD